MPIRFRCKYCNQLIGIARRKAGTVVACPTCHGKLDVPASDVVAAPGDAGAPLFEQHDFEDFLRVPFREEAERHSAASRGRSSRPAPAGPPLMIDVERLPDSPDLAPPPGAGVLLTPVRLAVVVVVVILSLAAAFAAGIAVDRLFLLKPGP
jgi:hypothetical protein